MSSPFGGEECGGTPLSCIPCMKPPSSPSFSGDKRPWTDDPGPPSDDPTALSRHHTLLLSSLQSAVIKSHFIPSQTIFALSPVSKEVSEVVRQNVRAIGGQDAKILLAFYHVSLPPAT